MDRRSFLKRGAQKTAEQAVDIIEKRVKEQARRWIRPPWAAAELDLLLRCTRCGDCITACPQDVIFSLRASLGVEVAGTPALDLGHKACLLCDDWPCVNACETGALALPELDNGETATPKLAIARIKQGDCLPFNGPECGACEGSCPIPGALSWTECKPRIDPALCVGCGQCRSACVLNPAAITLHSLS